MPITATDYRFHDVYKSILDNDKLREEFEEIYYRILSNWGGHQIGGYPYFTQEDPRYDFDKEKDFLLLQMDSDRHFGWGDAGVANFFIEQSKLESLDFTEVLYNWDCH